MSRLTHSFSKIFSSLVLNRAMFHLPPGAILIFLWARVGRMKGHYQEQEIRVCLSFLWAQTKLVDREEIGASAERIYTSLILCNVPWKGQ